MSLIIFFGSAILVVLVGAGVIIQGWRHHYREDQKKKLQDSK